jgi:hypothetical protein
LNFQSSENGSHEDKNPDLNTINSRSALQIEQDEVQKEILKKIAGFKEDTDQLKMYCKKNESPSQIHYFLFFQRPRSENWTAKVYTEYFDSKSAAIKTKKSSEFSVLRSEDLIQSTEDLSKLQFHLEFPTINSLAEVKFRPHYEGDRTPQSLIPKQKQLNDVQCYEKSLTP